MTLAENDRYKLYQPVVLTTDYLLDFPIFGTDDVEVWVDGVIEILFSITATFVDGRAESATVVLASAVTGVDVEVYGKRTPRRENSYLAGSPELAANLQRDIEATTAVQQEQARDFDRSIKLPVEDGVSYEVPFNAAARATKFLYFDASGTPALAESITGVGVTSFMATVLDDADATTARATLGIIGGYGDDVASGFAINPDLSGNYRNLTGTATIGTIDSDAGIWPIGSLLTFIVESGVTFQNSTDLVLGGSDISVAAGGVISFRKHAAGDWTLVSHTDAISSGTFTATLVGCATSPTVEVVWRKQGDFVTMFIPEVKATSNATTCWLSGVPTALQNGSDVPRLALVAMNNAATVAGFAQPSGATIILYPGPSGIWTPSGTKGIEDSILTYYVP